MPFAYFVLSVQLKSEENANAVEGNDYMRKKRKERKRNFRLRLNGSFKPCRKNKSGHKSGHRYLCSFTCQAPNHLDKCENPNPENPNCRCE